MMKREFLIPPEGSPAHAGIDPAWRVGTDDGMGFPRTRGDRPLAELILDLARQVPPHTRG